MLSRALKVLTRTDNLYAVRFVSGLGGQEDEVNRRFIEMYANQGMMDEKTKNSSHLRGRAISSDQGSAQFSELQSRGTARRSSAVGTRLAGVVSQIGVPVQEKMMKRSSLKVPLIVPERTMVGNDDDI